MQTFTTGTITFDDVVKLLLPLLPNDTTHTKIGYGLRAYRSGDLYLFLECDGVGISFLRTNQASFNDSETAQLFFRKVVNYVLEYNRALLPVEYTLEEIAEKLRIPVDKLRIKEK